MPGQRSVCVLAGWGLAPPAAHPTPAGSPAGRAAPCSQWASPRVSAEPIPGNPCLKSAGGASVPSSDVLSPQVRCCGASSAGSALEKHRAGAGGALWACGGSV